MNSTAPDKRPSAVTIYPLRRVLCLVELTRATPNKLITTTTHWPYKIKSFIFTPFKIRN